MKTSIKYNNINKKYNKKKKLTKNLYKFKQNLPSPATKSKLFQGR